MNRMPEVFSDGIHQLVLVVAVDTERTNPVR
jgi:hypothetical protein